MSLNIFTKGRRILLEYMPMNGIEWINEIFSKDDEITIKRTFTFSQQDSIESEEEVNRDIKTFIIGELENDYYKIHSRILMTQYDVLINVSHNISINTFIVSNNISILNKFEKLANQQIIIGGYRENAIPDNVFRDIINSFPTRTEINYYIDSRITNVLSQYLEGVKDSGNAFEKYLKNRIKIKFINSIPTIKNYEYEKYQFILDNLRNMLSKSESYREDDWQNQIIEIILVLYPKYIRCFSKVKIKDYYTNPNMTINRYIDLMLVDSNGNIDVIEIKKPYANCVITKNTYRDNYTPLKELSGTIMQIEKYLFHLNKWGVNGEKALSSKYQNKLPKDLSIKITSPKGLVILGRENNMTKRQLFDFEIIKRKYSNVIDIITYDDLINRLKNILYKFNVNKK